MNKIAFCGASGNGISPLEQIMIKKGYEVYGSDLSFDEGRDQDRKKALQNVGLHTIPQDGSGITPDMKALYVSSIINEENPDVQAARKYGIPIKKRSDLLCEIFSQYEKGIAIGGTAGKTTTTAMIGYILDTLGYRPCMINGGMLCNYQNNPGMPNYLYYDNSKYCVIEADESDGSIQKYHPYIGIINNISHDHTSMEKLIEYFTNFATHVQHALIINKDCPVGSQIKAPTAQTLSFSMKDASADFYASNIRAIKDGVEYQLDGQTFRLGIIGTFNIANALAAIAACSAAGINKFDAAKALEGFTGVKVRLEKIGTSANDITIYNDFAHNPGKLAASISALKEHPGRIIAMYQPHTPFSVTNTRDEMAPAFVSVLEQNDILIMQEIYELTPNDNISSNDIINDVKQLGHSNATFFKTRLPLKEFILQNAKKGDRIIIMGAHDNSLADFSRELLSLL